MTREGAPVPNLKDMLGISSEEVERGRLEKIKKLEQSGKDFYKKTHKLTQDFTVGEVTFYTPWQTYIRNRLNFIDYCKTYLYHYDAQTKKKSIAFSSVKNDVAEGNLRHFLHGFGLAALQAGNFTDGIEAVVASRYKKPETDSNPQPPQEYLLQTDDEAMEIIRQKLAAAEDGKEELAAEIINYAERLTDPKVITNISSKYLTDK